MSDAEKWINGHLKRLRSETRDWPRWLLRPMKPASPSTARKRARAIAKRERRA